MKVNLQFFKIKRFAKTLKIKCLFSESLKERCNFFFIASLKFNWHWILLICIIAACAQNRVGGEWSIPSNLIFEGEGNNDIPALDVPNYTIANQVDFLTDSSIVLGMKLGAEIHAYPLDIMVWHEVVNDAVNTDPIAMTYSTLTGSSIGFSRMVSGQILNFKVSGLLHNSNSIFNEVETNSDWLQFQRKGVRGIMKDVDLSSFPVFEMKWSTWKALFPNSKVLNRNTGYNRPYGTYPYGDYETDSTKIFFELSLPIDSIAQFLHPKEKILGVNVNGLVKGYRFNNFSATGFSIIEDEINGEPLIIIGSQAHKFLVAYSRKNNVGKLLNFTADTSSTEIRLVDNEGNYWNIFGESIENSSLRLNTVESNIAYWFAWKVFSNNIEIY